MIFNSLNSFRISISCFLRFFFVPVAPVLQAPQQLGLCDALTLDASASLGGFGFPFAATWSLLAPSDLPVKHKFELDTYLAASSAGASGAATISSLPSLSKNSGSSGGNQHGQLVLTIPSRMLQNVAAPFVFQLNLTNALGRSASTSVSVSKSALPLFPIYLSGPAVQSVRRAASVAQLASTDYTLAASTVCGATVASMSVQFTWRQLQSSGQAAAAMGATMTSSVVAMALSPSLAVANETIGFVPSRATLAIPARTLRVGFVYGA